MPSFLFPALRVHITRFVITVKSFCSTPLSDMRVSREGHPHTELLVNFVKKKLIFSSFRQQTELRLLFGCRRQQTEGLVHGLPHPQPRKGTFSDGSSRTPWCCSSSTSVTLRLPLSLSSSHSCGLGACRRFSASTKSTACQAEPATGTGCSIG